MLTALIAAVAGIAGLVIGRWRDIRSESDRWRRDRRARSYEEVRSSGAVDSALSAERE